MKDCNMIEQNNLQLNDLRPIFMSKFIFQPWCFIEHMPSLIILNKKILIHKKSAFYKATIFEPPLDVVHLRRQVNPFANYFR